MGKYLKTRANVCVTAPVTLSNRERKSIMAEGMIILLTAALCLVIFGAEECHGDKGIRNDSISIVRFL